MTPSLLAPMPPGAVAAAEPPRTPAPPSPAPPRYRIALVSEYYYPHHGGVCEHVHFLARELRSRGHHVDIVTSRLGNAPAAAGVIRLGHSVPVYSNGSLARITVGAGLRRAMRDVLRGGGYDLVHVHSPLSPTLPMLAILESPAPIVGTIHTYFPYSRGYRLLGGALQPLVDRLGAVIAVSETARQAHARYFDADWRIIPNGVDLGLFRADAPRPPLLQPGVRHVLFLGRLDPRNGLATLIAAFRQLAPPYSLKLVVAGDGPLRGHYERLAAGDPDILFVGAVHDDRPGYYANCDVYACPTDRASFGITLLEAMACGTPIVCSDIVGFRDVVTHERQALMVPCGDRHALADALTRVLDDGPLQARLAACGSAHAARYGWPMVTDELLAVYEEVIARTRAHR